jgi:hypothetical protein
MLVSLGGIMSNSNNSNNVKVPYSYFVKSAQRDYNNPKNAFWREFLQNSVDAKSKNIEFKLYRNEQNKVIFECNDDGCGMTEDIIRNKLLTLGETSKDSSGSSTGGFGVAKILIYFSHPAYQIRTQDNIVIGSGGSYEITKGEYVRGTKASVEINPEVIDTGYLETLTDSLFNEISLSYLPNVNITINGRLAAGELKRGREVVDLGDIVIYKRLLRDTTSDYALVRVNGLHMFSKYIDTQKFQLVVELKTYSVNVLTTNRDGFKWDWQDKVSQALNEICQDPSKTKKGSKVNLFKGKSERYSPVSEEVLKSISENVSGKIAQITDEEIAIQIATEEIAQAGLNVDQASALQSAVTIKIQKSFKESIRKGTNFELSVFDLKTILAHNVYIQTIGNYRKIPTLWRPENFSDKQKNLLDLWGKIVGLVLRDTGHENVQYDVGYIFDDGTQGGKTLARYTETTSGLHIFFLNPIEYGEQKFFPAAANKRIEVILWLLHLAVHEVTHYTGYNGHNHEFVSNEATLKLKVLHNIQEYLQL